MTAGTKDSEPVSVQLRSKDRERGSMRMPKSGYTKEPPIGLVRRLFVAALF